MSRPGSGGNGVIPAEFSNTDRWIILGKPPPARREIVDPLRSTPKYEAMLP